MAPSLGTSVSSNSFSRWASHDIFLFKYHFLLYILRFLFFFSDNIMADVASKQRTTVHSGNTTVSSVYLPTPRRHHLKALNLPKWIKKRRPSRSWSVQFALCFYPPQSHEQEDTQNWQTWRETCAVSENVEFSFSCSFFLFTVELHNLS